MYKLYFTDKTDFLYLFFTTKSDNSNQCEFTCFDKQFIKVEDSSTIDKTVTTILEKLNHVGELRKLGKYKCYEKILFDTEMEKLIEKAK